MDEYSITKLVLETQGYPGTPVFDYFNGAQLQDLAQGLGLDLAISRQVSLTSGKGAGVKATVKVLELQGELKSEHSRGSSEQGALATAVTLSVIARLQRRSALAALNATRTTDLVSVLLDQKDMWAIIQGTWRVEASTEQTSLRLTRKAGGEPVEGQLELEVLVPEGASALTPSGRIRLSNGAEIDADVLAQPVILKASQPPGYTAVAHAVFARVGGYNFRWMGASRAGGGVDSDF